MAMIRDRIVPLLIFLVGFVLGVYYFFPVETITAGVRNYTNERLPKFVSVSEIQLKSFQSATVTVTTDVFDKPVNLPIQVNLRPSFNNLVLNVFIPPRKNTNSSVGTITGRLETETKAIEAKADSFPIQKVIPGQKGRVSGQFKGYFKDGLKGNFSVSLNTPKVREYQYYPSVLRGTTIHRFTSEGTWEDRTIKFQNMDFVADKFLFNGTMTVTLDRPLRRSVVDIDFDVKKPFEREIRDQLSFRELGF